MQDIKMISKTGNMGDGKLDWDFVDGSLKWLSEEESIIQAIMRGTISPVYPVMGYGCDCRELRGTKQLTTARVILLLRIQNLFETLSLWYQREILADEVIFTPTASGLDLLVRTNVGEAGLTVPE